MRTRLASVLVVLVSALCLLASSAQGAEARKLRKSVKPTYPEMALKMRVEGIVKLEAVVGKDGNVSNVIVVSGPTLLKAAAVDCVKQWQYEPATDTTLVGIDVNFRIAN